MDTTIVMKIFTRFFLILGTLLLLSYCKKENKRLENPNPAPPATDPYTYSSDLQSSKDISAATYHLLDIDMMAAFVGQRTFNHFYTNVPSAPSTNSSTAIVDTMSQMFSISFNNTPGRDGKQRTGSVFFYYGYNFNFNRDAKPQGYRYCNYGFSAAIYLFNYSVDDWLIELADSATPAHIICRVSSPTFDPATINLSWEISGKFRISNLHASGRDMIWDGKITKTLTNTSEAAVFNPNKMQAIDWPSAQVSYSGQVTGTYNSLPFTYTTNNTNSLHRDFTCSVLYASKPEITQFHPITNGVAVLSLSNYHPRTIDHGPLPACDNSGVISFHGETYKVDFE